MTNKTIGKHGEDLAQTFLIKRGFKILERNFHYSKNAEIDIIATKNNVLHFVEVKTRTQNFFGTPLEAITKTKLKQIFSCAQFYMQSSKKKFAKIQIDAIGIVLNKENQPTFTYIEDISL